MFFSSDEVANTKRDKDSLNDQLTKLQADLDASQVSYIEFILLHLCFVKIHYTIYVMQFIISR